MTALLWIVYALMALIFAVSLRRPFGALAAARRQSLNVRRELKALSEASEVEAPQHLSPTLARMLEETRMLRIALAEPLQAAQAWHAADASKILAHVDIGDGSDLDRCDEVDMALVNARRAVWEWVSAVERLPDNDQRQLERLGLHTGMARGLLTERNALQRLSHTPRRELERIEQQLNPLVASLDRFETGLLRATGTTLYR
ncbi:MAG: hypothetical protein JNK56_34260 [Myxococcales bacterium]|nr:hypothetical protein [Myxococcales bacterium]